MRGVFFRLQGDRSVDLAPEWRRVDGCLVTSYVVPLVLSVDSGFTRRKLIDWSCIFH